MAAAVVVVVGGTGTPATSSDRGGGAGHVQAEHTYMQIHGLTNGHTHTHTEGSVSHSNETFRQHLLPFRRPSYLSAASQVVFQRPAPEKYGFLLEVNRRSELRR